MAVHLALYDDELLDLGFISEGGPAIYDGNSNEDGPAIDHGNSDVLAILNRKHLQQDLRVLGFLVDEDAAPTSVVCNNVRWPDDSYEEMYSIKDGFVLWALANMSFEKCSTTVGLHDGSCKESDSDTDGFVLWALANMRF